MKTDQGISWVLRMKCLECVDSGAIILQRSIDLPEMSDPTEVHQILQGIEHELLPEAVRLLARGAVTRDPENPRRLIVTP